MSVKIVSLWYGALDSPYARMARVLEFTARKHHENVTVERVHDRCADRSEAFLHKARDWRDTICAGLEGNEDVLCLLDTDTFLQRTLIDVQFYDFDIAVTTHNGRLNSGVLFVRPSRRVVSFFASWPARTRAYCRRNSPGDIRFGDQDALGDMLKDAPLDLRILRLPMAEWNSTQLTWQTDLENARIVHFKSDARASVFEGAPCSIHAKRVAYRWLALESEARGVTND